MIGQLGEERDLTIDDERRGGGERFRIERIENGSRGGHMIWVDGERVGMGKEGHACFHSPIFLGYLLFYFLRSVSSSFPVSVFLLSL